jgi:hypothetical protein
MLGRIAFAVFVCLIGSFLFYLGYSVAEEKDGILITAGSTIFLLGIASFVLTSNRMAKHMFGTFSNRNPWGH